MRFLPHEHAAFAATLAAHGVDIKTVLFVKRRGRLHVQLAVRADMFIFFRKKITKLDGEGRWKDHTNYFIGEAREKGVACAWEDVLRSFGAWLAQG